MSDASDAKYTHFVNELAKPGADILGTLTPLRAHLLHMAVGVASEAGELLDAVKKHVIYNKDLDSINVLEELGDIEFYLTGLRSALGFSRAGIIDANMMKLSARYREGYSDRAAQERADKNA